MTEGLVPAVDLVGILVVVGGIVVDVTVIDFVVNLLLSLKLLNTFFTDASVVHSPYLIPDNVKELDVPDCELGPEPEPKDGTLTRL